MVTLIIIFFCGLAGGLIRAVWGWLNSGEPFIARKFASTMIGAFFLSLPIAVAAINTNVVSDLKSILVTCALTLLAGWGVDDGLKQLSMMRGTMAKTKKNIKLG